jgi:hypothetical protein
MTGAESGSTADIFSVKEEEEGVEDDEKDVTFPSAVAFRGRNVPDTVPDFVEEAEDLEDDDDDDDDEKDVISSSESSSSSSSNAETDKDDEEDEEEEEAEEDMVASVRTRAVRCFPWREETWRW